MITLSSEFVCYYIDLSTYARPHHNSQIPILLSSCSYRQKVVVRSAARSTRIINSLYPQFVRDSLLSSEKRNSDHGGADVVIRNSAEEYDEEDPQRSPMGSSSMSYRKKGLKSKVSDFVDTPGMQLKRFLSHPTSSRDYDYNLCMEIGDMEPIAEVFEKTTVMLADIEGFTAWW